MYNKLVKMYCLVRQLNRALKVENMPFLTAKFLEKLLENFPHAERSTCVKHL